MSEEDLRLIVCMYCDGAWGFKWRPTPYCDAKLANKG